MFSSSTIIASLFAVYIANSIYGVINMFSTPTCQSSEECLTYYLSDSPQMQLWVLISPELELGKSPEIIYSQVYNNFNYSVESESVLQDVPLPESTKANGTLHMILVLVPQKFGVTSYSKVFDTGDSVISVMELTTYQVPITTAFDLLKGGKGTNISDHPITHLKSKIGFNIVTELQNFPMHTDIPGYPFLNYRNKHAHRVLLPIMNHDFLGDRLENLVPINENDTYTFILKYTPIHLGKFRFVLHIENAFESVKKYGFSDKDLDQLKSVFGDTNLYLLCVTLFVASLHILLDFLAMKNDINFWRKRTNMIGVSLRTVLWRALSQIIIFLYLLDEQASLLVVVPYSFSAIIELWKVHRVLPVDWRQMKFKKVSLSKGEKKTRELDAEGMQYLSLLLYPICILGAIYSLLYEHHKSWYSWTIHSLVNGVYAFGFLFMLPQLFINYKLKSVAHLPWKAFMFKAFNTFIDDLFAFILTMPVAHRIACFRDDVVFLVYLYQRWLYPVDGSRTDDSEFVDDHED